MRRTTGHPSLLRPHPQHHSLLQSSDGMVRLSITIHSTCVKKKMDEVDTYISNTTFLYQHKNLFLCWTWILLSFHPSLSSSAEPIPVDVYPISHRPRFPFTLFFLVLPWLSSPITLSPFTLFSLYFPFPLSPLTCERKQRNTLLQSANMFTIVTLTQHHCRLLKQRPNSNNS